MDPNLSSSKIISENRDCASNNNNPISKSQTEPDDNNDRSSTTSDVIVKSEKLSEIDLLDLVKTEYDMASEPLDELQQGISFSQDPVLNNNSEMCLQNRNLGSHNNMEEFQNNTYSGNETQNITMVNQVQNVTTQNLNVINQNKLLIFSQGNENNLNMYCKSGGNGIGKYLVYNPSSQILKNQCVADGINPNNATKIMLTIPNYSPGNINQTFHFKGILPNANVHPQQPNTEVFGYNRISVRNNFKNISNSLNINKTGNPDHSIELNLPQVSSRTCIPEVATAEASMQKDSIQDMKKKRLEIRKDLFKNNNALLGCKSVSKLKARPLKVRRPKKANDMKNKVTQFPEHSNMKINAFLFNNSTENVFECIDEGTVGRLNRHFLSGYKSGNWFKYFRVEEMLIIERIFNNCPYYIDTSGLITKDIYLKYMKDASKFRKNNELNAVEKKKQKCPSKKLDLLHSAEIEILIGCYRYRVKNCYVKLEKMPSLDRLMSNKSSEKNFYFCDLCDPKRLFLSKTGLSTHINNEHVTNFLENRILDKHLDSFTQDTKAAAECISEEQDTNNPIKIEPVSLEESFESSFSAPEKAEESSSEFESSFMEQLSEHYVCEFCNKKFLTGHGLASHKTSHRSTITPRLNGLLKLETKEKNI